MSTMVSVGALAVISTLSLGVVVAGGAAVTAQRVSAAADAAALAAADARAGRAPGAPCDQAEHIASLHGVSVTACTINSTAVQVTVHDTFAGFGVDVSARAGAPPGGLVTGSDGWVLPSDGAVTSGFGEREGQCDESGCASTFHEGVDFAAGCGAPIYAARAGTVVQAQDAGGYGNQVRIDHGDGLITGYAHIAPQGFVVSVGESVSGGQLIAIEGDTGQSFGCHVHFSLEHDGIFVDPMTLFE